MNTARVFHTATVLSDGRVLVAGGRADPSTIFSSAELYLLTPATDPPVVTQQPLSRTLGPCQDTTLSVQVAGDGPFTYQWRLNGSAMPGATGQTLALPCVTPSQAGPYTAVVTGPAGTVTSAPASVAVFDLEMVPGGSQTFPLLILDGAAGTGYRLEWCGALAATNWTLLAPVTPPEKCLYYVDDPVRSHAQRFYRAMPR